MTEKDEMAGKTIVDLPALTPVKSINERVKEASKVSVVEDPVRWTTSTIKDVSATVREMVHTSELFIFAGLIMTSNWWICSISSPLSRDAIMATLLTVIFGKVTLDKRNEVIEKSKEK